MIQHLSLAFGLAILCAAAPLAAAPADTVHKDSKGVAINGYDTVAYFTDSKPVKGSASFSHQWMGATWWFSSAENRDKFAVEPEKYAPQYGGFCAYGMSDGDGHRAPTDPDAWRIIDGKLYLNYSRGVQQKWSEEVRKRIDQADRNWPRLQK